MRDDIVLAGFVLTAEEWAALDRAAQAQLLRAAGDAVAWRAPSEAPGDDELTGAAA